LVGPFVGLYGLANALYACDAEAVLNRRDVDNVRRSLVEQLLDSGAAKLDVKIEDEIDNAGLRDIATQFAAGALQAALNRASEEVLPPEAGARRYL
jgi:hypothetical protein